MTTVGEIEESGGNSEKFICGGISETDKNSENSIKIDSLGRFAVDEHNKKANALLEFGKVVKTKEQDVAGIMYYLTLEATDGGKKKVYEAKVWVQSWLNSEKELTEFKLISDA